MITSVNDTNVWISGIHWPNEAGRQILVRWQENHFKHCLSFEILFEIIRVLREVFAYPDDLLYDWYWLLLNGSALVAPESIPNVIKEDPDDNKFIACALAGGAQYIVSEDNDLKRLGQYDAVQIVSKQVFLRLLDEG